MVRMAGCGSAFLFLLAATAAAQDVQVKVIEIKGSAETRAAADKPWTALKVGDILPKGAWIQTGLRSRVFFKFGDNTVVQVKSATLLQIADAGRASGRLTGRLQLALGNVHVEVDKSSETVDFKVVTPQVTTSVKGTGFDVRSWSDLASTRVDVQHGRVKVDHRTTAKDVLPGGYADSRIPTADLMAQMNKNIALAYDGLALGGTPMSEALVYATSVYAPMVMTTYYTNQRTYEETTTTSESGNTTTTNESPPPVPVQEQTGTVSQTP